MRAVVPPTRNHGAANKIDTKPCAPVIDDLRFDLLLDEKPLAMMFGAGVIDFANVLGAGQDAASATAFGRFDDKWLGKRINGGWIELWLAVVRRHDERGRQIQATGDEVAVDFSFIAGVQIMVMGVENVCAVGVEQLIELEKLRVFVTGAVEKPEKPAFAALDFGSCLSEVVQTDQVTIESGLMEGLVEEVYEIAIVLPIPRDADLIELTGGLHAPVQ